mmetsp:Transcript_5777/g.22844  ORF Transcript_5777/g.22844 Transcript_5777/m.22844 type:complete len:387 (+) Transcript_5777:576-1736(+)
MACRRGAGARSIRAARTTTLSVRSRARTRMAIRQWLRVPSFRAASQTAPSGIRCTVATRTGSTSTLAACSSPSRRTRPSGRPPTACPSSPQRIGPRLSRYCARHSAASPASLWTPARAHPSLTRRSSCAAARSRVRPCRAPAASSSARCFPASTAWSQAREATVRQNWPCRCQSPPPLGMAGSLACASSSRRQEAVRPRQCSMQSSMVSSYHRAWVRCRVRRCTRRKAGEPQPTTSPANWAPRWRPPSCGSRCTRARGTRTCLRRVACLAWRLSRSSPCGAGGTAGGGAELDGHRMVIIISAPTAALSRSFGSRALAPRASLEAFIHTQRPATIVVHDFHVVLQLDERVGVPCRAKLRLHLLLGEPRVPATLNDGQQLRRRRGFRL